MKQNEKKRVVFYCRVATDDQRGTAMERQAQSLREYAEGKGYEIIKEIQEKGSGRTMDRTGIRAIYILAGHRAMDETNYMKSSVFL
jgi:predicted site-specific integrase-resolvase